MGRTCARGEFMGLWVHTFMGISSPWTHEPIDLWTFQTVETRNDRGRLGEQRVNSCRIRAPGLGKIWTPAALSADKRRQRLDDIPGVEAALQIRRHGRHHR